MPVTKRTVLKNLNKALLEEELKASSLPFILLDLVGFGRVIGNKYESAPATEQQFVTSRLLADKTYFKDFADPGELRIQLIKELTTSEDIILDDLLTAHVSTQRTTEQ